MPIAGLGTDIIEIARLSQQLAKSDRLAKRILTEREFTEFACHQQPVRFLAKRFATKEAAVKALGTGIGNGISWQHIEVTHDEMGKPLLNFEGHFAQLCQQRGIHASHVSISDEQHYAVATVILESE